MRMKASFLRRVSVSAAFLVFAGGWGHAQLPGTGVAAGVSAVTAADVDVANCQTYHNGKPADVNADAMLFCLGLAPLPHMRLPYQLVWSAGTATDSGKDEIFQYRLAFKQPASVGAVALTTQTVAYLKPDAPYPGDPAKPEQWVPVAIPPLQGAVRLAALPPGVSTRALLFTDALKVGRSHLAPVRVLAKRFHNVAHEAGARAKAEFTGSALQGSHTSAALDVVQGRGPWESNGKTDKGNIVGPFISDVEPSWFLLNWDEPRTIAGIYLQDNFGRFKLQNFVGAAAVDPVVAVDEEWKIIPAERYSMGSDYGRWIFFKEPLTTRALRFFITKALAERGEDTQIATISSILAITDLGGAPLPVVKLPGPGEAPFAIPYELAAPGFFTLAVNDAKGIRQRNLVAREERAAGKGAEHWDLRDEKGELVKPGEYEWKAITHPGLALRYEMTPYPNVTNYHADRSAWLNERDGGGGWLADHSPPYGACTMGDYVFLNAPVTESGVGFICCDLTGRKLWAMSAFDSWSSGQRTCTDGKTVFAEQMGWGAYGAANEGADRIWAIDPEKRTYRTVMSRRDDARRKRGINGMAAREGKVYAAISATPNWLANPAGMDVVDIDRCVPFYKEKRKPKFAYEMVPDARDDFFRLWRMKGTPPGAYCLTYLESSKGPERRQFMVLAFKEPVAIGGAVLPVPQGTPYAVTFSVLKPDAPADWKVEDNKQWQEFEKQPTLPWDVATAPPGTMTRAVRITCRLLQGGDDIEDLMEETGAKKGDEKDEGLAAQPAAPDKATDDRAWLGRLEGLKLLRWRFVNLFSKAKIRVSSGTVDAKTGEWDAQRTAPITPDKPGIYVMDWPEAVAVRGLAVMEIDGKRMEVDVWTGAGAPADIASPTGWEKVGDYTQALRDFHSGFASCNVNARYMDGYVDFGREVKTRALRLRIVEQWTGSLGDMGTNRPDRGGKDVSPAGCRIFGVAPVQYIGGEAGTDPLMFERIEVVDSATGNVEKEIPIAKPGNLTFAPDGTLYALSGTQVVKVDLAGGKHQPFVTDLEKPQAMATDAQGTFYAFDAAPARQVIRVYSPAGKYLRDIGEPGGYRAGAWNPKRLQNITGLAVDKLGQLWATSSDYWPKRVAVWKSDGTYLKEYLGPTAYGSGGVLDPGDKRRLFYGPLEFELDWETGKTRLKNLTWTGGSGTGKMFMPSAAGEIPIRVNGRTYLVTRCEFDHQPVGIVYLYETDHLKMVAAMGLADSFAPLKDPAILAALAPRVLPQLQFQWTDRNGDGAVQFDECLFEPLVIGHLTEFDRKLNVQAGAVAFEVKEFLANGAPVYVQKRYPFPVSGRYGDGSVYRMENGTFYRFGGDAKVPDAGFAADGTVLWTYKNEGAGVGPDRSCGPFTPDQVVCQFGVVGHEVAPTGDLGEFFVINANLASWNVWTVDGLLAGRIFRDLRDPKRIPWSMKEHQRGLVLDDVTPFQEHFSGWFCRTPDNKYYLVAGHHQANVVEVLGLDGFKRLSGKVTVTGADIAKATEWERDAARAKAKGRVRVLDAYPAPGKIKLDGDLEEWTEVPVTALGTGNVQFRLTFDETNLYLAWEAWNKGPFLNTGREWDRLFKTGGCVDLMLATDDKADPKRRAPVAGDKRLLIARSADGVHVVLYDAVVAGTPADKAWSVHTMVSTCTIDVVRQLPEAKVVWQAVKRYAVDPEPSGYIVEAAIPLKSLGLDIGSGKRLKCDWGILETDKDGTVVLARSYWSNQATSTLADLPTEAQLQPDLWGFLRLHTKAKDKFGATGLLETDQQKGAGENLNLDEP